MAEKIGRATPCSCRPHLHRHGRGGVAARRDPGFCDVDADDYNLDIADLERRVAEPVRRKGRLKPRAAIAVDLFGLPADYVALNDLAAREKKLFCWRTPRRASARRDANGMKVGRLAPVTATSFFPAKPLGCYGDGGALDERW